MCALLTGVQTCALPIWELPEAAAAPEAAFLGRRTLMKVAGSGAILASVAARRAAAQFKDQDPTARLYPVRRNPRHVAERTVTPEDLVTTYNNFSEFGSHNDI